MAKARLASDDRRFSDRDFIYPTRRQKQSGRPSRVTVNSASRPTLDHRWNANFKKLEKYIKQLGTWRVKKSHDIRLSEWLKRQKRNYENLSIERRRKLRRVGVKGTYQTFHEAWNLKFEELEKFKKEHGHLIVGKSNKSLFEWIHNQKWMKTQGKLTSEREKKLSRIGFAWSGAIERKRNDNWEKMFVKFSQLQLKYGMRYILVLKDHKDIHAWVDSQKHNKRKIKQARLNRLNAIQFPWKTRELQTKVRATRLSLTK